MGLATVKRRQFLSGAATAAVACRKASRALADDGSDLVWGNVHFLNFHRGEARNWNGRRVTVLEANACSLTVDVEGAREVLPVGRRTVPASLAGLRLFVADTKAAAALTADEGFPRHRGLVKRDALLAVCDGGLPLVDERRFTFPIDRAQGFTWSMEENSHQFGFISPERSHEGIDIGMHEARGYDKHALVAIENAIVRWVEKDKTQPNEACVLLESEAQPGIFYVYQHLYRHGVNVKAGAKLARGARIGTIWGDGVWGHLHFAAIAPQRMPTFAERYENVINAFPTLHRLWHGEEGARPRQHAEGTWIFNRHKAADNNRKYLSAYDPIVGYGWRIENFCGAMSVEAGRELGPAEVDTSARLRHVLFAGTRAEARNPRSHYDFEIDVAPGRYEVQVRVGDLELATWQRLSINEHPLGTLVRPAGGFSWTHAVTTPALRNKLILRVHLRDKTPAALSALSFRKVS